MGNKTCCKSKDFEADEAGEEAPVQVPFDDSALSTQTPSAQGQSGDEPQEWNLPPGKNMTVMMFGMTGSGKSALGNLIAGFEAFDYGDDTISVTNLDSVLRYESEDGSLVLLDTIGLGDTEIDQTKVVSSIRDVALSAPGGVDVLLFVMRNSRITDDAIARLVFATEYLWGSECLLNLYIVVTHASRYLYHPEEAQSWIDRQSEINWRFRHIYKIVGNNPNRFIFIDNPDPKSGEPNVEERRAASRQSVMKVLSLHPLDAVPPFTFSVMKRAKELTGGLPDPPERKAGKGQKKRLSAKQAPKTEETREKEESRSRRVRDALLKARKDEALENEVKREVIAATLRFQQHWDAMGGEAEGPNVGPRASTRSNPATFLPAPAVPDGVKSACKRLANFILSPARRRSRISQSGRDGDVAAQSESNPQTPEALVQTEAAGPPVSVEMAEHVLNDILTHVKTVIPGTPQETFFRLDKMGIGAITPIEFTQFLRAYMSGIKHQHIGGLWRRADLNCDGQLDLREFCTLLGP